jgi:hypothetical protein
MPKEPCHHAAEQQEVIDVTIFNHAVASKKRLSASPGTVCALPYTTAVPNDSFCAVLSAVGPLACCWPLAIIIYHFITKLPVIFASG